VLESVGHFFAELVDALSDGGYGALIVIAAWILIFTLLVICFCFICL